MLKTEQTLSVSSDGGAFEWSSQSLRSMFNKPSRIFDLGMWRMLFDVARFNTSAVRVLCEEGDPSIGEYLQREGYSTEFRDNCLIVCALSHPLLSCRHESVVHRFSP